MFYRNLVVRYLNLGPQSDLFWLSIYSIAFKILYNLWARIWATFWIILLISCHLPRWIWIILALTQLPLIAALPEQEAFSNVSFKIFSQFIKENFSSKISLSQVLIILFTVADNPDLLSLHARQQNPIYKGENKSSSSGWIRGLARALQDRLEENTKKLFKHQEAKSDKSDEQIIGDIGNKLDSLTKVLKLYPCDENGIFQGKLKAYSYESIQPAQVICPNAVVCETSTCNPRSLVQITKTRDIPKVTLIKGSHIYENVQVLTGKCPTCQTLYLADRERAHESNDNDRLTRVYLNSAEYLKVGQTLWVDRIFSNAVLNGMYSFHASAAAYTEFWNNSFGKTKAGIQKKITRRQVWQAFVQESVRSIAAASNQNLELQDGLAIDEVTKEAFSLLGDNGIIRAADKHACSECTQPYKKFADIITGSDPAALVGVDENRTVPSLAGQNAASVTQVANDTVQPINPTNENTNVDGSSVTTMAVLDGVLIGPPVLFFSFRYVL